MRLLEESLEDAPIVEKDGYQYFVHPVSDGVPMVRPELLREIAVSIIQRTDVEQIDKIVTPAAMGIHISSAVSMMTDIPMVVIRKKKYGLEGEVELFQETGYDESQMYINDVDEGDRVLVIDDVLSTGGTLTAITQALEDEIGAEIVDTIVAIRKADGVDDFEIDYDVQSLVNVIVEDGEVKIVE